MALAQSSLEKILEALDDPQFIHRTKIEIIEGRIDRELLKMLLQYKNGKVPDKLEVTGKDGGPIKVIRHVIVDPKEEGDV